MSDLSGWMVSEERMDLIGRMDLEESMNLNGWMNVDDWNYLGE